MTAPRIIVRGATTALTRRTTLRKSFLAPWHPHVDQAWLYALASAQQACQVAVHHSILVLTHHHTMVTADQDNLPEFLQRFHRDFSCALNTLLARERYDQPGELFDDRSTHLMRLLDAPAQSTSLVYAGLNCVAAGLVERPEHMPGFRFTSAALAPRGRPIASTAPRAWCPGSAGAAAIAGCPTRRARRR